MSAYIERLIRCGFKRDEAYKDCCDFIRDFPFFELQFFVESMEEWHNVERIQS